MDKMFKYDCNLNVEAFIHMLDDPTECYKFYWLDSIMQLLMEDDINITFDSIISGMIADAWYSVSEYHLIMGTRDSQGKSVNSIERAINKLNRLNLLEPTADRRTILDIIKKERTLLHDEKYQISKNVPYRLLSSFVNELDGNSPLWDQRTQLIAYFEMINRDECLPYIIGTERGLNKRVIIDYRWRSFMLDNMVAIRGWIQLKKVKYLQARNPGVPGIIYKLQPENEKQRKLNNVRKLWSAVTDYYVVLDIYSGRELTCNKYEIDHFIPWSYITNDEMWNLMPVDASLNSSKRDRLPNWNKYFSGFADNQFVLNNAIYKYPEIKRLFRSCQRDNLNSLWALEYLYIEHTDRNKFFGVLEKGLKPIYDSARIQGYTVWEFCNKV